MSVGMTSINNLPHSPDKATSLIAPSMVAIARRQRWQDVLFHRGTQAFSLLVLAALAALWRYRAVAVKQFGGVTGDLAGWFLQRAELWMLAALLLSGRWLG